MAKTIADAIGNMIFKRTLDTLLKKDTPVLDSNAEKVAAQVTRDLAPVVRNATNSEPWYQSRIYIGLIAAGLGGYCPAFRGADQRGRYSAPDQQRS